MKVLVSLMPLFLLASSHIPEPVFSLRSEKCSQFTTLPGNGPDTCIAVPSAFTPNKDGKNEKIGPIPNGCTISSILFRIYNRRGQVIFESENIGNDWDGTVKGKPQDTGVYPYVCYYTPDDGINRHFWGTITLIR